MLIRNVSSDLKKYRVYDIMGSDKMLRNLKVESHTREVLCNKAKSIGTICSVDELHKNKPKNGVLIVSITANSGCKIG